MWFRKRRDPADHEPPTTDSSLDPAELTSAGRLDHKGYTIVSIPRQLHNGLWMVRTLLDEQRSDGLRRYDFMGPMKEYPTEEEAREAGIEHAKERLDRR